MERIERLTRELRVELFIAAGLLVSACEQEREPGECRQLGDCIVDTTTWGPTPDPQETGGGTGDEAETGAEAETGTETGADADTGTETESGGSAVGSEWGDGSEPPYTRVSCVPLQAGGTCPAPDSDCLFRRMENRHGSFDCSCGDQYVFSDVLSGPDPTIEDACCYEVRFSFLWCVAGRPFVVEGELRRSPVCARSDWAQPMAALDVRERERRGQAWLEAARMEHASVAAFARMARQLMALGAPAQLLRETLAAAADELVHARLCFSVASQLLGRELGPGALEVAGDVPRHADLGATVTALVLEGCLGESVAAAQARLAASCCAFPALAAQLERIHADETRHAQLAVRTLAWLCTDSRHGPRTGEQLTGLLLELEGMGPPDNEDELGPALVALDASERLALTAAIHERAVLPTLRALARQSPSRG